MDCFDGLITLDDTCAEGSGVLELQAVGITETFLASITGPEDEPFKLLAQVEEWAGAYITSDMMGKFGPKMITRTFVDRQVLGDPQDEDDVVNAANTIGGLVIEVEQSASNLVIDLINAGYWGKTTNAAQVFTIYDLLTGATVDSFTLNVTADNIGKSIVSIALPAGGQRQRYFIAHTALDTYRTEVGLGSCTSCGDTAYKQGGMTAYGARMSDSLPKKYSNIQRVDHTSGLIITATLKCDHKQWLCDIRSDLALPYLYKVAQGIMDRAIQAVDRMNNVTFDKDLLIGRAEQYEKEYDASMERVLAGISVPMDPVCFSCRKGIFSIVGIP